MLRLIISVFFLVTLALTTAQLSNAQANREQGSLESGGNFLTTEGRFAIRLPTRHHGFQRLSIPTPFGPAKGEAYVWQLKEGSFVAGHADASQPVETPEVAKQVFDLLRDSMKRIAQANSGVVGPEKVIELDKHPGLEQRVDLFTGTMIQRTYLVSRRIYQTLAVVKVEQREYQPLAIAALDSFRVLTDTDIAANRAEEIAKAEPSPLPQESASGRPGTDASDQNLVGRVKTVLQERENLTGRSEPPKKRDSFDQYNESGNLVRRELYDSRGNPSEIRVYGYLEGNRVSRSKSIQQTYDPPSASIPIDSSKSGKKSDPRYDLRYEFKYDDQKRLIEEKWFLNNGDLTHRVVHKYDGMRVETLMYSSSGQVTQDHIALVDEKGNEVERTARDPRDGALGTKYSLSYEFDPKGNWIKRTASKVISKDGAEKLEPQYIYVRTITYY